jgi:hypothetical protein
MIKQQQLQIHVIVDETVKSSPTKSYCTNDTARDMIRIYIPVPLFCRDS